VRPWDERRHGRPPIIVSVTSLHAKLWVAPVALVGWLGSAVAVRPAVVEVRLAQSDGAPLDEAVLTAFPLDGRALAPPKPAVMDQRGQRFEPHVLPVQTGARVSFPNSDTVSHHVYSFSPARRFEIFLRKGAAPKDVVFDKPGVVALGCNVHDWMLAYVYVVDTPYFALTAKDGTARLAALPAGRYRLEAWHPRLVDPPATLHRDVGLAADSRESWSLRLEKALLPARDQRPRFVDY
jgi:plastocyanin